jgi:ABC-type multidrug transport system fused ATPase/permease subunit
MRYDTFLAEGGWNISAGQRQRLILARALLSQRRILVLDEATSDLDSVAEARIQRALERRHVTRIVIAHRLSTIRNAHRILVMEKGRIVESGTHGELLDAGGPYSQLVLAQTTGRGRGRRSTAVTTR